MGNTEKILRSMLNDIEAHNRDRKELLNEYVQKRLDKSLENYYNDLMKSYESLIRKDATRVLKRINKKEENHQ